jgi:hypothetical protein
VKHVDSRFNLRLTTNKSLHTFSFACRSMTGSLVGLGFHVGVHESVATYFQSYVKSLVPLNFSRISIYISPKLPLKVSSQFPSETILKFSIGSLPKSHSKFSQTTFGISFPNPLTYVPNLPSNSFQSLFNYLLDFHANPF